MTPEQIAAARALVDAATPGPWKYRPDRNDDWGVIKAGPFVLCQVRDPEKLDDEILDDYRAAKIDPWEPNARFIAWCRDGVPAILDALAEAEARAADLTAKLEAMQDVEADLKSSVVAFGGVWAADYAKRAGYAPGELHPTHYDILKDAGARMDDFRRAALEAGGAA